MAIPHIKTTPLTPLDLERLNARDTVWKGAMVEVITAVDYRDPDNPRFYVGTSECWIDKDNLCGYEKLAVC